LEIVRFRPSHVLTLAMFGVALAASGCGKDAAPTSPARSVSTTSVTAEVAQDVAAQFGKSMANQGGVPMTNVGTTSFQDIAADQAPSIRGNSPLNSRDGSFSSSFTVRFFDANGTEQPTFINGETASLSVVAMAHGELVSDQFHSDFGTLRTLDVTGLLPVDTTITINGALNDTANCVFMARDSSASREYHLLANGTLVDVVVDKNKRRHPFPLSGTATWMASVDRMKTNSEGTKSSHFEVSVVVTFNGTRHPNITVNKTFHFQTDLETGQVTRTPA
jgi:hypothetical protein